MQPHILIQQFLDEYQTNGSWNTYRSDRTKTILPMVLEHVPGDILEIGAHAGLTTKIFCEIGARYDRRIHVIDPWDGRQEGNHSVYESFKNNCGAYENLRVHQLGSEDPKSFEAVKDERFAYILIDGLHSYDALKHDFTRRGPLVNVNGIICIDDWNGPYGFCEQIRRAASDNMNDDYRMLSIPTGFIENYIVRLK